MPQSEKRYFTICLIISTGSQYPQRLRLGRQLRSIFQKDLKSFGIVGRSSLPQRSIWTETPVNLVRISTVFQCPFKPVQLIVLHQRRQRGIRQIIC